MKKQHNLVCKPSVSVALSMTLAAIAADAMAQKAPIANYWVSAETATGMPMTGGAPSMRDMASLMLGGGMNSTNKSLLLQLGSQQSASGDPAAEHEIPSALNMGKSLPLVTPKKIEQSKAPREDVQENYDRPKGRLLIFWGCGETARAGQPVILDFAKLSAGQWPAGLFSRRVNIATGPSFSRSKTYGDWPNTQDSTRVPSDASLKGDHVIKGNYSPEIKFTLSGNQDFLEPLAITMNKAASKALNVSWKSVTNATGYFANVMGGSENGNDMVWWTSSNSKEFGESLFSYIAPTEVARLIKEKVVLPPGTTQCTVPKEVLTAAPHAMLRMIAYGEEANFAYPPKPKDGKAWNPEWTAKVRVKSTSVQPIMDGESSSRSGGAGSAPGVGGVIKGLFGF